jgi:UDP-N-acetyl-2-amino-2-deoxyglucuronate dehydrogenase
MIAAESNQSSRQSEGRWTVYRQGDDGNRFVLARHITKEEADRMVAEFESRGHKQVYWAEPEST